MRRMITMTVAVLLALAAPAAAHDAKLHHAMPTHGSIRAVAGDHLTVDTGAGTISVVLDAQTRVEQGEHETDRGALHSGETVDVFGTKLPSGELVAREIHIGDARGN